MDEPLFEIECWRGRWYYKCGSRYTGPYPTRLDAGAAARQEAAAMDLEPVKWARTNAGTKRGAEAGKSAIMHR